MDRQSSNPICKLDLQEYPIDPEIIGSMDCQFCDQDQLGQSLAAGCYLTAKIIHGLKIYMDRIDGLTIP